MGGQFRFRDGNRRKVESRVGQAKRNPTTFFPLLVGPRFA